MPELPEVETVKRVLEPQICGRTIVAVSADRPEVIAHPTAAAFFAAVRAKRIAGLGRRGKFLLIRLDGGVTLVVHLRMTGQLLATPADHPMRPHTHVVFQLDNGMQLRFTDTRRFGRLWLKGAAEDDDFTGIHKLGPEPFDVIVDAAYLEKTLGRRSVAIKQGLLDQTVIAGIGNIYSDEILFTAKINPRRRTPSLKKTEWKRLAQVIPQVMEQAVADNSVSAEEFLAGEGKEYRNTPFFQVYGREGEPCKRCGVAVKRVRIAGRSSFYCPKCQKGE